MPLETLTEAVATTNAGINNLFGESSMSISSFMLRNYSYITIRIYQQKDEPRAWAYQIMRKTNLFLGLHPQNPYFLFNQKPWLSIRTNAIRMISFLGWADLKAGCPFCHQNLGTINCTVFR